MSSRPRGPPTSRLLAPPDEDDRYMQRLFGLDREEQLDAVSNVVPLVIITLLTLLFVAYNPWGWRDTMLVAVVFGLHLVPIVTLAPVTYVLVRVVVESERGQSQTADRVRAWFE